MKKLCFLFVLVILIGFPAFINTQEEVDFLLFFPNSGSQFADEEQTMLHLDNVAIYLMDRNISPGQIRVEGYTAVAANDIDSLALSMERALHVINELQKRGVPEVLFAEPVAFGAVDIWGSNVNENSRILNRRVRIILDELVLTSGAIEASDPDTLSAEVPGGGSDTLSVEGSGVEPWVISDRTIKASGFPWILLFLAIPLIAVILFFALRSRKKTKPARPEPVAAAEKSEPIAAAEKPAVPVAADEKSEPIAAAEKPAAPVAAAEKPAAPVAKNYTVLNLEEEIRFRAYELYLERNCQNGDAYGDWCKAIFDVCARYEATGHETYTEDENWQARRQEPL